MLAVASQVPVVPTLIYGSRQVHARGTFRVHPGTIHVHFLTPILTAGLQYDDREELARTSRDAIAACLEREYGVKSIASHRVRPVVGVSPSSPDVIRSN